MTQKAATGFEHLDAGGAAVGRSFSSPLAMAYGAMAVLTLAGWAYLGLMAADMARAGLADRLGPGMGLIDALTLPGGWDALGLAIFDALCRPSFGHVHGGAAELSVAGAGLVAAMWAAMTLAMMLPTAAPMIATYAEIADTAARKGERAVSPMALVAGYVAVWLGFALAATALQIALSQAGLLNSGLAAASGLFAGAIFLVAGLYQFTPAKHACLTRCQRPMPFFFSRWSDRTGAVVRMGVDQGLDCLGCCWALMLVMFAVGVMNVVWMAGIGLVMMFEKTRSTLTFTRAVGVALMAIGVWVAGGAVLAGLPLR